MNVNSVLLDRNYSNNVKFRGYSEVYQRSAKEIRQIKNKVDIERIFNNLLESATKETGSKTLKNFDMISSSEPLDSKLQKAYERSLTLKMSDNLETPLVRNGEDNIVKLFFDRIIFTPPKVNASKDIRFWKNSNGDLMAASCNNGEANCNMTVSKKSGNLKRVWMVGKELTYYKEDGSIDYFKTLYKRVCHRFNVLFRYYSDPG